MSLGIIVVAFVLGACSRSEPPPPPAPTTASTSKDPAAARKLIAAGAIVVDVRTAEEYAEAHLPQAINIPVQELPTRIPEIEKLVAGDKARPIVVYCAAGSRAAKAKAKLDAAGYSNVVNGGGLDDLATDAPRN
jgi:rhodanese-related sulfurtransferase